ncbi:MAG: hypothetical protein K0R59_2962 [Sphingobacterium sp.]|jgi:hypothetical protein|nr:hypothetical protein [Sphingobacterium sp.]
MTKHKRGNDRKHKNYCTKNAKRKGLMRIRPFRRKKATSSDMALQHLYAFADLEPGPAAAITKVDTAIKK